MSDLLALLIIITAFGSLTAIGLVILLCGLVAAQRTSSVIACAAVAATLFAVQLGWMAFWNSLGVGFGGEGGKNATIIQWGSVAAVALVAGFLALKLPGTLERAIGTARWLRDGARVSAVMVGAYVLHLLGIEVLPLAYASGGAAPPIAPATWLPAITGAVLAWGLWGHLRWAWYAAVGCSVYAVFRIVWLAYPGLTDAPFVFMATPAGVRLLLLVVLLGVLLFSNARKVCVRNT